MSRTRKTAVFVGVLYIIGTVAAILSVLLTQSAVTDPDYLTRIAADENQIVVATLLWLTVAFALAMVPVQA